MPSTPARIHALSTQLANQIAAGEVVERPASVLKELLENSLDAGAARIDVEVERGGTGLIRVRDDGGGIHRDDLHLALSPHATSKIRSQEDLERIASLGFRGEALASIGSVSRLSLTSRHEGAEQAWCIAEIGAEPTPAAHPVGTTVEVRDLFYNTPARRKFLRSESTEFFHLEQLFKRVALSRFGVALSLHHNRREVLRLREVAPGERRRVADVIGPAFARDALSVDFAVDGLRLWGWLSPPTAARAQADVQYFYVNGRLVRDRLIGHALRQAHRDRLEEGRHPAYVLYLEIDVAQVDVNVHPTKHEVRFRETRRVHDFLFWAVQQALGTELFEPANREASAPLAKPGYPRMPLQARVGSAAVAEQMTAYQALHEGVRSGRPPRQTAGHRKLRLGSVLHGRYLLLESDAGPLLVDGGAAREALALAALSRDWEVGAMRSRPLLVPQLVALGALGERLDQQREALEKLGFEITAAGEDEAMVRRVPLALGSARPDRLAVTLLEALAVETTPDVVLKRLAACLREAPAEALSATTAQALLEQLDAVELTAQPYVRELGPERLAEWFDATA